MSTLSMAEMPVYNGIDQNNTHNGMIRTQRSVDDYKQHSQITHIYTKPDTVLGSVYKEPRNVWLLDTATGKIGNFRIDLPQGIERVYFEALSNAGDNADASRRMNVAPGSIEVTMDEYWVKIRNGGEPIPLLPTRSSTINEPKYVVDAIFGELLTSSNYDEKKVISMGAGKNGYGSKVVSIFSKHTIYKVGDPKNGQEWVGVWKNNMSVKESSVVTPGHAWNGQQWVLKGQPYRGPAYVEVMYALDFYRFGYEKYPPEAQFLFARDLVDFGFTCKIPVTFNGQTYNVQKIKDYAKLFWSDEQISKAIIHYEWAGGVEPAQLKTLTKKQKEDVIGNPSSPDFIPIVEIMCFDTPDKGVCLSFVNGLMTSEGGSHVDLAYSAIGDHILDSFKQTSKGGKGKGKGKDDKKKDEGEAVIKLNVGDLKQHMSMIIAIRVPNPNYKSQSKTIFTTPKPIIKIDEDELKPMSSWELYARLDSSLEAKLFKLIKKDEKKSRGRVHLEKGIDANFAGTDQSSKCILYIVEGKSASAYPKKRIAMTPGNKDYSGYYPIKGKFSNIMKMTPFQISQNKEINDIKKILGLREGVDYSDPKERATLRYGLIVITTDMDTDGSHIRMLLISFFNHKYPSIIRNGMIVYLMTFAVRLYKGKGKGRQIVGRFASVSEYERWEALNKNHGYEVDYFKGLGTNLDSEIKDDISHASLVVCFYDESAPQYIDMAFGKDNSDLRKSWMNQWRNSAQNDEPVFISVQNLIKYRNITDIINKDLINYSIDSLFRAIPSDDDLIKKSQRQALYYMLHHWKYGKSNAKIMKVDRVGAAASELTHYHHGPDSMIKTIVHMAQRIVGTNNLPICIEGGQMGTRDEDGKDAASARYISTGPEDWVKYAIHKDIVELIPLRQVENEPAEPEYIPMDIPIGIVNGWSGIATGWSSFCAPHSPYHVIDYLLMMCNGKKGQPLKPVYNGFKGTVELIENGVNTFGLPIPLFNDNNDTPIDDGSVPDYTKDDDEDEIKVEDGDQKYIPPKSGKRTIVTTGIFQILKMYPDGAGDVLVTELPIGVCMLNYHKWLQELEKNDMIHSFKDNSETETVYFLINKFKHEKGINLKTLRLQTSFGYNNITLIDKNGHPKIYDSINDVMDQFYHKIIKLYETLRQSKMKSLMDDYAENAWKREMIFRVINGDIIVFESRKAKKAAEIYIQMDVYKIPHSIYTKIKLSDFSEDNIEIITKNMNKLLEDIETIKNTRPEYMYASNLMELRKFLTSSQL